MKIFKNEYKRLNYNDNVNKMKIPKKTRKKYFNIHIRNKTNLSEQKILFSSIFIFFIILALIFYIIILIIFNKNKNKEEIIKQNIYKEININESINNNNGNSINITISDIINENTTNNISSPIKKEIDEEYKDMQEYIYQIINDTLINPNETFKKSNNPKISIIITIYNGESYLSKSILSIQNQNFKEIEIIIIDGNSKDNSINIIKELMKKDPRIKLYQNEENKGILFTKSKGILNSNGKYLMILNQEDIYVQKDAFSTLYEEAEKNNLDILGFGSIESEINLHKGQYIHHYLETTIFFQPYVAKRMYDYTNNKIKRVGDVIYNYFFKTELFKKTINQIDDKYLNTKMNYNQDFLLFFLITRNAINLKQIKRIFYIKLKWAKKNNKTIIFKEEDNEDEENLKCLANINYIEFLLNKTDNNFLDKKIASFELENMFLNNKCKNNKLIKNSGIYVCELFLENKYIENEVKDKIFIFLNQTNR